MPYELITALLNFPGFQVSDIRIEDRSAFRRVFVTIESLKETDRCGSCRKTGLPEYDSHEQEVRHLLWWQSSTVVRFKRYRVQCPDCGVRTEALDFVDARGPHVTKSLGVSGKCKIPPKWEMKNPPAQSRESGQGVSG